MFYDMIGSVKYFLIIFYILKLDLVRKEVYELE